MYKDYQILDKGYTDIKNIVQGNFNLHQIFLDGLLAVSPAVKNYERIDAIINAELSVISEYKTAYSSFQSNGHFTTQELDYISNVYSSLVNESLKNLDELTTVITANQLRMSDDERISAIDRIYNDMSKKLGFLRDFNRNTSIQGLHRAQDTGDIDAIKSFYGLP
jgi:excinuclease UvrABC helicase subunit UvrB